MINLPTKFEVFTSIHYKDMKRDTNYEKWGGFSIVGGHPKSLKIAPFDRTHTSSIVTISLSGTISLNCRYSENSRQNRSKVVDCNLPHLHLAPRCNFAEIFGINKLESLGYCMAMFA